MSDIKLTICEPPAPAHGDVLVGTEANFTLCGTVDYPTPESLYYKWYSSLNNPAGLAKATDAPKVALNWPDHAYPGALETPISLTVGSHIITLTAKDVKGDTLTDMQKVQQAGFTGGPEGEGVKNPYIIHVCRATIVEPTPPILDAGSDIILGAEAPLKWGKKTDDGYIRDNDYHKINRIRYRWRFEPDGGGTPVVGLPPLEADEKTINKFQEGLTFALLSGDPPQPVVRYEGPWPAPLTIGVYYHLVLRVEDKENPVEKGHETIIRVLIV